MGFFGRAVILTCMFLMLVGCKIEITVPEGGYVQNAYGETLCAVNQTCVIEAKDFSFDTVFIATPFPGYKFVSWERKHRGLCGGRGLYCHLFTRGFRGNAGLEAFLSSDELFYLNPVFAPVERDGPVQGGSLPFSADQNLEAIGLAFSAVESALQLGQTTVDTIIKHQGSRSGVTDNCSSGGTKSFDLLDSDGDFRLSAGDQLNVTYDGCFEESIDRIVSGTALIKVSSFSVSTDSARAVGSVSFEPGFRVTSELESMVGATVSGDLGFRFSLAENEVLEVKTVGRSSLSFDIDGTVETISDFRIKKNVIRRQFNRSDWTTLVDLALTYDSQLLGGDFRCESIDLHYGRGSVAPSYVNTICRGRGGTGIRVRGRDVVAVDSTGSGPFQELALLNWGRVVEGFISSKSELELDSVFGEVVLGSIDLIANDISFDRSGNRLLVTTAETDDRFPNSLLEVDTEYARIRVIASFDVTPNLVRISNGGEYIYVSFKDSAVLHRYRGGSGQLLDVVELTYDEPSAQQHSPTDIAISPVDAGVVAVSMYRRTFTTSTEIVILDDMRQRPNTFLGLRPNKSDSLDSIVFDSSGRALHALRRVLSVDATGIVVSNEHSVPMSFPVTLIENKFHARDVVVDDQSLVELGSYFGSAGSVGFDTERRIAIGTGGRGLRVHDLDRYTVLAEYELNRGVDSFDSPKKIEAGGGTAYILFNESIGVLDLQDASPTRKSECLRRSGTTASNESYSYYSCPIVHAIYDEIRGRTYAALGAYFGLNGNSVAVIDSASGAVIDYVPVAAEPSKLALTANGERLLVSYQRAGLVTEIEPDSLRVLRDIQIPLTGPPSSDARQSKPRFVHDLDASTIDPGRSVVLLKDRLTIRRPNEQAAIANGRLLPDTLSLSHLFSANSVSSGFNELGDLFNVVHNSRGYGIEQIFQLASGLALGSTSQLDAPDLENVGAFVVVGNQIYFDDGSVIDLSSMTIAPGFDLQSVPGYADYPFGVVVDHEHNHVYFAYESSNSPSSGFGIARFNARTRAFEAEEFFQAPEVESSRSAFFDAGSGTLGVLPSDESGLYFVPKSSVDF